LWLFKNFRLFCPMKNIFLFIFISSFHSRMRPAGLRIDRQPAEQGEIAVV
jgi:hypothetical protein